MASDMTVLFYIQCPTCRARLQVRSAAAIGQILTCPKCGGMVQVEPPPDWEDPEAAQETVDDIPVPGDASASDAAPADEVASPVLPGNEWVSPQTQAARRKILAALAIVALLLVVVVLVATLWKGSRKPGPSERPEIAGANGTEAEKDKDGEPVDQGAPSDEEGAASGTPAEESPPEVGKANGAGKEKAESDGADGKSEPSQPDSSDDQADHSDSNTNSRSSGDSNEDAGASEGNAKEPEKESMRDSEAKTDQESTPPGLTPADAKIEAEEKAAAALSELEAMIHPPSEKETSTDVGSETSATPAATRRRRDVEALLQWKVPEWSMIDVPLFRAAEMIRQVGGVPVSLDLDALAAAGIDWRKTVSGHWKDTPLQKVLEDLSKQAGVRWEATPGGVRWTAKAPERFAVRYAVDQLPAGDKGAEAVARWLPKWLAPVGWESDGNVQPDNDRLVVTQPPAVHRQLRRLQTLYLWHRWDRWREGDALPPTLAGQWTLVVVDPTPLAEVLKQVEEITGVTILVDWESAAEVGCEPDSGVTVAVYQQPLMVLLRELVRDSQLSFRVVDKQTVAVAGAVPRVGNLGMHGVPEWWAEGELLKKRIGKLLEAIDPQGKRAAYFDDRGRCLLLLGTAREHAVLARALKMPPQPKPAPPANERKLPEGRP